MFNIVGLGLYNSKVSMKTLNFQKLIKSGKDFIFNCFFIIILVVKSGNS